MQAAKTECGSWSFSTSSGRRRRPPSTGRTRIRMRSGEARRSGRNWPRGAEGHSGGGGLFSSFLQETPGRPLEDFDVLDVDEIKGQRPNPRRCPLLRCSYSLQTVTLQLPRLVLSKNELSGSLRRRAKPPRPSWPLVPCSIPGPQVPARKPVG